MLAELQEQLTAYYAAQPTSGTNIRIANLRKLSSGWSSDVYAFTLRYDQQDGNTIGQHLVIKAYTNTTDGIDRALKERHALFNLRAARYPVPGVAVVEINPTYIGRPFIVMEQVDGQLLWDAIQTAEAEHDTQRRAELVSLFVSLLVDLHELGAQVLVPNVKPMSEYTLVNREIYTLRGLAKEYDRPEFNALIDWLYERRKEVPCTAPVVTHRDYTPWNVLITDTQRPFVVDWGWQISDPRYDLAWTLTLLERSGFRSFRDEVLAEYERVTGGAVEALDYFEVLATARWLMNVTNDLRAQDNQRSTSADGQRQMLNEQVKQAVQLINRRTGNTLPVAEGLL